MENFQSAAGAFQFLHDNFLYAPSVDMQLASTEFLVQLMLTQAFECRLELRLERDTGVDALAHLEFAQEASAVCITAYNTKNGITLLINFYQILSLHCRLTILNFKKNKHNCFSPLYRPPRAPLGLCYLSLAAQPKSHLGCLEVVY